MMIKNDAHFEHILLRLVILFFVVMCVYSIANAANCGISTTLSPITSAGYSETIRLQGVSYTSAGNANLSMGTVSFPTRTFRSVVSYSLISLDPGYYYSNITFWYNVSWNHATANMDIHPFLTDPSSLTAQYRYLYADDGIEYLNDDTSVRTKGAYTKDLTSSNATYDFNYQIDMDLFTMGFHEEGDNANPYLSLKGPVDGTASQRPQITVRNCVSSFDAYLNGINNFLAFNSTYVLLNSVNGKVATNPWYTFSNFTTPGGIPVITKNVTSVNISSTAYNVSLHFYSCESTPSALVNNSYNWSTFCNITAEGAKYIGLIVYDSSSYYQTWGTDLAPVIFILDWTAPTLTMNSPTANDTTLNWTSTFNYTCKDNLAGWNLITPYYRIWDNMSSYFYIDGALQNSSGLLYNNTAYVYTIPYNLSEGNHNWTLNCSDGNNTAVSTGNFTFDAIAPTITFINPSDYHYYPLCDAHSSGTEVDIETDYAAKECWVDFDEGDGNQTMIPSSSANTSWSNTSIINTTGVHNLVVYCNTSQGVLGTATYSMDYEQSWNITGCGNSSDNILFPGMHYDVINDFNTSSYTTCLSVAGSNNVTFDGNGHNITIVNGTTSLFSSSGGSSITNVSVENMTVVFDTSMQTTASNFLSFSLSTDTLDNWTIQDMNYYGVLNCSVSCGFFGSTATSTPGVNNTIIQRIFSQGGGTTGRIGTTFAVSNLTIKDSIIRPSSIDNYAVRLPSTVFAPYNYTMDNVTVYADMNITSAAVFYGGGGTSGYYNLTNIRFEGKTKGQLFSDLGGSGSVYLFNNFTVNNTNTEYLDSRDCCYFYQPTAASAQGIWNFTNFSCTCGNSRTITFDVYKDIRVPGANNHFWFEPVNYTTSFLPNGTEYSISAIVPTIRSLTWNGTYYFLLESASSKKVQMYWPNFTYTGSYVVDTATQCSQPRGMALDGNYVWVGCSTGLVAVYKYWLNNGTYISNFTVSSLYSMLGDGTYIWVMDGSSDSMVQYWTNGTSTGFNFSIASQDTTMLGGTWDGTYFWLVGSTGVPRAYQYYANGSYTGVSFATNDITPNAIYVNGSSIYVGGTTDDNVVVYTNNTFNESRYYNLYDSLMFRTSLSSLFVTTFSINFTYPDSYLNQSTDKIQVYNSSSLTTSSELKSINYSTNKINFLFLTSLVKYPVFYFLGETDNPPTAPVLYAPVDYVTTNYALLNVSSSDPDNDYYNVSFYNNDTEALLSLATNDTFETYNWTGLNYGEYYTWYVNVTDGPITVKSDVWNFTTAPYIDTISWLTTGGLSDDTLVYGQIMDQINASILVVDNSTVNVTVTDPTSTKVVDSATMTCTEETLFLNCTYDASFTFDQIGIWTVEISSNTSNNIWATDSTTFLVAGANVTLIDGFYGYDTRNISSDAELSVLAGYDYEIIEFDDNATTLSNNWTAMKAAINYSNFLNMHSGLEYHLNWNTSLAIAASNTSRTNFILNISDLFDDLLVAPYLQSVSYIKIYVENDTDDGSIAYTLNEIGKNMSDTLQNRIAIVTNYNSSSVDDDYVRYDPSLIYITSSSNSGLVNELAAWSRNSTYITRIFYGLNTEQKIIGQWYYQNIMQLLTGTPISTSIPDTLVGELSSGDLIVFNNQSTAQNYTTNISLGTDIIGKDIWDYNTHILLSNVTTFTTAGQVVVKDLPAYTAHLLGTETIDYIRMTNLTWGKTIKQTPVETMNSNYTNGSRTGGSAVTTARAVELWDGRYNLRDTSVFYGQLNQTGILSPYRFNNTHYLIIADKNNAEVDKLFWGNITIDYVFGYISVADYNNTAAWQTVKRAAVDEWITLNGSMNIFLDGLDYAAGDPDFPAGIKNLTDYIKITKGADLGINVFTNYHEFAALSSKNGFAMRESCTHRWWYANGVNNSDGYNYTNQYWNDTGGYGDYNQSRWYNSMNINVVCVAFMNRTTSDYLPNSSVYYEMEQAYIQSKVLGYDYFALQTPYFALDYYDKFFDFGAQLQRAPTENGDVYSMRYENGIAYYNTSSDVAWFDDGRLFNSSNLTVYLFDDASTVYNYSICVNDYCGYTVNTPGSGWAYNAYNISLNSTVFNNAYGHYLINISGDGYVGDDQALDELQYYDKHSFYDNSGTWAVEADATGNHMVALIISDRHKATMDITDKLTQTVSSVTANNEINSTLSSDYTLNKTIYSYYITVPSGVFHNIYAWNGSWNALSTTVNSVDCIGDNPTFGSNTITGLGTVGGCFDNSTSNINARVSFAGLSDKQFKLDADNIKPDITVSSPANTTYTTTNDVWFNASVSEDASWCGYSLNGNSNISMTNATGKWYAINTSMIEGTLHNVIIWCNDTEGNMNYSSTVYFAHLIPPTIDEVTDISTHTPGTILSYLVNVSDLSGESDISYVDMTCYGSSSSEGASDDWDHYTNMTPVESNIDSDSNSYNFTFNISNHAESGTWTCIAIANDTLNNIDSETDTFTMNTRAGIILNDTACAVSGDQGDNDASFDCNPILITHDGNVNMNITISGTNLTDVESILVGNITYDATALPGTALTDSAVNTETYWSRGTYPTANTTNRLFWLDIPIPLTAGDYTGTITLTAGVSTP